MFIEDSNQISVAHAVNDPVQKDRVAQRSWRTSDSVKGVLKTKSDINQRTRGRIDYEDEDDDEDEIMNMRGCMD